MLKGNKGDWSELYVLISLLADGKLYQSDIDLNKDLENIYEVTKGYKNETDYVLTFDREIDKILVKKIENGRKILIKEISFSEFKNLSNTIYKGIVDGKGLSFGIDSAERALTSLQIQKLKESSSEKADIHLKVYDFRLAKETELGFSIKSLIGGNSTLFNPGPGTNFIFDIFSKSFFDVSAFNKKTYKSPNKESKLTYRIKELEKLGAKLSFSGVQSEQLWRNLKMIDGDLPNILAFAIYYRWLYKEPSLKKVSEILEKNDPLNFYFGKKSEQKMYEYKIMRFLTECAMGMTPESKWMGEYDKFGGVIVAKEDGDIVAFHIYDFNLFRKYLINNTVFEQPSTGEDESNPGNPKKGKGVKNYYYGWLYEEEKMIKMKFNLQVRFR